MKKIIITIILLLILVVIYRAISFRIHGKTRLVTDEFNDKGNQEEIQQEYVEHEVICYVTTLEEANDVAKYYDAEVMNFSEGVATLKIKETVEEFFRTKANIRNDIPKVYKNRIRKLVE
ncbi:MAG: hypothetical protein PHY47_05250 [Lachnospiraceae bacterium]|nr:hypothetical protein [Lachnospiraceae bacterium]